MVNNNAVVQIQTADGYIKTVNEDLSKQHSHKGDPLHLTFDNAIIFPGLINSHDHLDFNLFSQYGNKVYSNYVQWAGFLHENFKQEIDSVLKIPKPLRTQWGLYKNLLSGITTVVNHGSLLKISNPLIDVIQPFNNLHSIKFEKMWKLKLNNPFIKNQLYCIHIGEGVDPSSHDEINELINWNPLNKKIIGVHAIAMNKDQSKKFKAIVWCPYSNYFLFEKTARINDLKQNTNIIFGTDSTLTANWNIYNHLRLARKTAMTSDDELFNMITTTPASVWGINCGEIKQNKSADIVVARSKNYLSAINSFFELNPEDILLVIKNGFIKLIDEQLKEQLTKTGYNMTEFSKIRIKKNTKYISGNLPLLVAEIKKYYPEAIFPFTLL